MDVDGTWTLEPHGGPSKPSSVISGTLLEEAKDGEEAAAAASAAAAWAAADLMAAVIAASSLGAGALLLARMAGAASRWVCPLLPGPSTVSSALLSAGLHPQPRDARVALECSSRCL